MMKEVEEPVQSLYRKGFKMKFNEEIKKYLKNGKRIKELLNNYSYLPKANGIYIVTNENEDEDVEFLDTTTAITEYLKNGEVKNLLYTKEELTNKYNNGNKKVLYIGKAECKNGGLKTRIRQLLKYAQKEGKIHRGGRALWQIKDWENKLTIFYCEIEQAEAKERELLCLHEDEYSVLPVANWRK